MGSESSPQELFEAVRIALHEYSAVHYVIFCTRQAFESLPVDTE